jgi:hypothetical protein
MIVLAASSYVLETYRDPLNPGHRRSALTVTSHSGERLRITMTLDQLRTFASTVQLVLSAYEHDENTRIEGQTDFRAKRLDGS